MSNVEITIESFGGVCPVLGFGTVTHDGETWRWCFRARGEASLYVDPTDPVSRGWSWWFPGDLLPGYPGYWPDEACAEMVRLILVSWPYREHMPFWHSPERTEAIEKGIVSDMVARLGGEEEP